LQTHAALRGMAKLLEHFSLFFKDFFSPPFLFGETLANHGALRGTADLLNIYISHFILTLSCKLIYIEIYISTHISHFILTLSCKLSCFYFLSETLKTHGASRDMADFRFFLYSYYRSRLFPYDCSFSFSFSFIPFLFF